MDVSTNVGEYVFNYRVAGIITHNGKILVHKNVKKNHYAFAGGRVKAGESSKEALKREFMEELGKPIEILKFKTMVENFFVMNEKKYHELMVIYDIEFKEEQDKKIEDTLKCIEPGKEIEYVWIPISEIEKYELQPQGMKEMLAKKEENIHLENYDQ